MVSAHSPEEEHEEGLWCEEDSWHRTGRALNRRMRLRGESAAYVGLGYVTLLGLVGGIWT